MGYAKTKLNSIFDKRCDFVIVAGVRRWEAGHFIPVIEVHQRESLCLFEPPGRRRKWVGVVLLSALIGFWFHFRVMATDTSSGGYR